MPSIVTLKAVITADDTQFHTTVQKDVKELGDLDKAAGKAAGGVKKLGDEEKKAAEESKALTEAHKGASVSTGILSTALGTLSGILTQQIIGLVGQAARQVVGLGNAFATTFSDINEQLNKNEVLFGKNADAIDAWAQRSGKAFGVSRRSALAAAGDFGNVFKSIGIAPTASAKLSKNLVQLAADLSSFNNKPLEESLGAIQSGLVGEERPLRQFGILLGENAVKAEAFRLGLTKGKGELSQQAKALATVSLITKQTTAAQGDYARTANSAANMTRTLSARYEDAGAKIGEFILPLKVSFMETMLHAIDVTEQMTPAIGKFIENSTAGFARLKTESVPILTAVWDGIKNGVKQARSAWDSDFAGIRTTTQTAAAAVWKFVQSYFGEVVNWFRENMPLIRETVRTVLAGIQDFWKTYGGNILRVASGVWGLITTVIRTAMRLTLDIVKLAMQILSGHWSDAGHTILKIVKDLFLNLVGLLTNLWKIVSGAFMGILTGVKNFVEWFGRVANDIGAAIVTGIVNGIRAGGTAIWDAITGTVTPSGNAKIAAAATAGVMAAQGVPSGAATPSPVHAIVATSVKTQAQMNAEGAKQGKALVTGLKDAIKIATPDAIKAAGEAASLSAAEGHKKLTEAQRQNQEFVKFAQEQRSALVEAEAQSGKTAVAVAKRFTLISQARRDEVVGIMERIKAITDEAQRTSQLADKLKSLRQEISAMRATTPTQKARVDLGIPFGPMQADTAKSVNEFASLTAIKESLSTIVAARKSLVDSIAAERREMVAASAMREVDRVSISAFGVAYNDLSDKANRAAVSNRALLNELKSLPSQLASSGQPLADSLSSTFTTLQNNVKPATDRLESLRREILLSTQTTMEGTEAVNLYGKAFENLSALQQGAIRNVVAAQQMATLGKISDSMQSIGSVFDGPLAEVNKGQQQKDAQAEAQRRKFVEGLTDSALRYGKGFVEALLGRGDSVKKWFANLVQTSLPAFADTVIEKALKPQLERLFDGMVQSVQGTLNITQQAVGQMLASVYSLLTDLGATGKKRQKGGILGGILGAALGFAIGGPAGALTGFNVGTAAGAGYASGGVGGALLGGGLSYVSSRGGTGAIFGGGTKSVSSVSMETSGGSSTAAVGSAAPASAHKAAGAAGLAQMNVNIGVVNGEANATVVVNKVARLMQMGGRNYP